MRSLQKDQQLALYVIAFSVGLEQTHELCHAQRPWRVLAMDVIGKS